MKTGKGLFCITTVLAVLCILSLTACSGNQAAKTGNGNVSVKIGVIRSDNSSEEAMGRERYLRYMGQQMNFEVELVSTSDEGYDDQTCAEQFAKSGCNAILAMGTNDERKLLETCEKLGLYLIFGGYRPNFEDTETSVTKDLSLIINDYSKYPHYLGTCGASNYGEALAGYQMGTAAVKKGYKKYTIFSGTAAYGMIMHAQRITGLFIAMHDDDPSVSYAGIECSWDNWKRVTLAIAQDFGVNLKGFKSHLYEVTYSTGGYNMFFGDPQAVADVIRLSTEPSDCVFCAGSADAIIQFAGPYAEGNHYVGNDAISDTFKQLFIQKKIFFDIAKFDSYMGPSLALLLKALYDNKLPLMNGQPVVIEQQSLQLTGAENYDTLNAIECADGGYLFSPQLVSAFITGSTISSNSTGYTRLGVEEWVKICEASASLEKGDLYDLTTSLTKACKSSNVQIVRFK